MKKHHIFLFALLSLLLYGSCKRLYGYRDKLNAGPKRIPVHFSIVNNSPAYINKSFETELHALCVMGLMKQGYLVTTKPKRRFDIVLSIHVDSAYHRDFSRESFYMIEKPGRVFARTLYVTFDMNLAGSHFNYWDYSNYLYFFDNYHRDLKRCKSLMAYVIRQTGEIEK